MIFDRVSDIVTDDIFLNLSGFLPESHVFLKLEGLNPAGSIKLKTATALVDSVERDGALSPGGSIIESSSGNLGIALSVVCAARDYPLTVVTDPNTAEPAVRVMESLGATVVEVTARDPHGGYLHTRIEYIRRRLDFDPDLVWLNQYANLANVGAHRERTAGAIHRGLGAIDGLFIGAGTTGTLMGCADYFSQHSPSTRVIAVDAAGSVTFGWPPAPRFIPGLGASRRPEIYTDTGFEKVQVDEPDTVAECRMVAERYGLLAGGSTGTVLAAVRQLGHTFPPGSRIAAISPDLGDKYINTIYSDEWVESRYATMAELSSQLQEIS